jgi:hypothetical protein
LTAINDAFDQFDEPNLIGVNPFPNNLNPSILENIYGESNVVRIEDSQDLYFSLNGNTASVKTIAKFVGVGTPGFTYSPDGSASFRTLFFTSGNGYSATGFGTLDIVSTGSKFRLGSRAGSSYHSSIPSDNGALQIDRLVSYQVVGNAGHPTNPIGAFVLAWDLGMSTFDNDFQDVVFEVSNLRLVAEPGCALLLAISTAIAVCFPRYRRSSVQQRLPW